MITKLNFDHLLEPLTSSFKEPLQLPKEVTLELLHPLISELLTSPISSLEAHSPHPVTHLPVHQHLFCLKADPIQPPFYCAINSACQGKLLEIFFESANFFSDDRLIKASLGFILLKAINLLNTQKVFSKLAFYLTEFSQTKESLQLVKVELKLESSYPLILDFYFPESFIEKYSELYKKELEPKHRPIPFWVNIHTGSVKLTTEELGSLRKSHVVFLDQNYYHPDTQKGIGRLVINNTVLAQVRITHHALKFLDFNPLPDEDSMNQNNETSLKDVSGLLLDLQVEFTTLKMELGQLETLTSGQTLEFHKENPATVYLTLQGQKMAKGELVKVGEKMAFLVQETYHG